MPIISKQAGMKHIKIAGLPIFLRLLISKDKPDLVRIITKAICLRYEEIDNTLSDAAYDTYGNQIVTVYYEKELRWATFQYDSIPITPEL